MKTRKHKAAKPVGDGQTLTVDISSQGRDEMNLAEFPITVLADRAPRGARTLIFRVDHGQLTITGSDAYGLPTAPDADVIVALIQLTKLKNDFQKPTVHFTRYELLRLLGWNNEGRSYRRLDESLRRWVGVTLHYANCWWDNRSKTYGDATLHILESAIILEGKGKSRDDEGEQALLPLSSFTWNKTFLESCHADNLKYLDVGTYFSLEHSASKRLYRFLDKRFYKRTSWVFDLREVAFERVGLSRNYAHNVAKIREKLQPAVEELECKGFLEPLGRDERDFKVENTWKIRLDKRVDRPGLPAPQRAEEPPPLLKALVERGVTRAKAEDLVRRHVARAHPPEARALRLDGGAQGQAHREEPGRLAGQGHRGRLRRPQGLREPGSPPGTGGGPEAARAPGRRGDAASPGGAKTAGRGGRGRQCVPGAADAGGAGAHRGRGRRPRPGGCPAKPGVSRTRALAQARCNGCGSGPT